MDKKLPRGKSHFKFKMNEWEDVSGLPSFKRRKKTKKKEYDEKVERGNEKKKRLD